MKTLSRSDQTLSKLDTAISRIVRQDVASKVQPVSSYQWAKILKQVGGTDLDAAVEAYNNHPEVMSYDSATGVGTLALDSKKKANIRRWMEQTDPLAESVVEKSTQDMAYRDGPWGETFPGYLFIFVGSKSDTTCNVYCQLCPMDGEAYAEIDWSLELSGPAQIMLFHRIKAAFDMDTSIVDTKDKPKYLYFEYLM